MTTTPQTEAQRLADRTTPYHGPHAQAMARELLRLETENQQLKTSLALVQQHHATAWNRGHQAGIRAGESAVKQATDAVKADAWGNTQLTNALMQAEAERDQLREALQKILNWNCHTNNYAVHFGSNGVRDFYREIARQALATTEPVMANGLTEAETDASASVVGLATTAPAVNQQLTTEPFDEREAFESEMRSRHGWNNSYFTQSNDGGYLSNRATHAYIGWQARAAMAQGVK